MNAFGIGWGGSLAVRKEILDQVGILEKWSKIMFEDTFTVNEVQAAGSKLQFVPRATMVQKSRIDRFEKGCTKFISRQLLNAHGFITAVGPLLHGLCLIADDCLQWSHWRLRLSRWHSLQTVPAGDCGVAWLFMPRECPCCCIGE